MLRKTHTCGFFLNVFSRVIRDSMTRCVGRSVCRSVGPSALVFFGVYGRFFALLLLPNCLRNLFYHCSCPPARNSCSRVYGLVLLQTATSIATAMVKQFGMSPLVGIRVFDDSMEEVPNKTKNVIDKEINRSPSENHTRWLQLGVHCGN